MDDITVPKIGTRVEVTTRYTIEWMNGYRRPTVGIVAHSNPWDKPGTFRLVAVENPENKAYESTIALERVESLVILGTSKDPENPDAAKEPVPTSHAKTFEIKGSKGNVYIVTLDDGRSSCTCPAGSHGRMCKHIKAAQELAAA